MKTGRARALARSSRSQLHTATSLCWYTAAAAPAGRVIACRPSPGGAQSTFRRRVCRATSAARVDGQHSESAEYTVGESLPPTPRERPGRLDEWRKHTQSAAAHSLDKAAAAAQPPQWELGTDGRPASASIDSWAVVSLSTTAGRHLGHPTRRWLVLDICNLAPSLSPTLSLSLCPAVDIPSHHVSSCSL